jgi:hypothetical protein
MEQTHRLDSPPSEGIRQLRNGTGLFVRIRSILYFGVFPGLFYFVSFALLTYPLLRSFSSHFFAGDGDGQQNIWNLWWVDHAVRSLQSPWHTAYLYYPYGISLLGHTLNPFNGFLSVVLLRFFTLVQTHNLIVIFGFVAGGLGAFLLCNHLTDAYWPSLIGGWVFTFSNYHFAHAEGHLQLVSLEGLPFFLLLWLRLLDRPTIVRGITCGISLFLVLLCDYYYFLYSIMAGAILIVWFWAKHRRSLRSTILEQAPSLVAFAAVCLITCGPLVSSLILLDKRDPLIGAHPETEFSVDLPSLVIPGGHWRFADLTRSYWGRLPGNVNEESVDLGFSVVILCAYAWFNRSRIKCAGLNTWFFIAAVFGVLSLGPDLHFWGRRWPIPLPYRILKIVFPPLGLSGMPVRMVVMVFLCGAVLTSLSLQLLLSSPRRGRTIASFILALMLVEYLPRPLPQLHSGFPQYALELSRRPGGGAVADLASSLPDSMYFQTLYQKPLAFGYVSRVPSSVKKRDTILRTLAGREDYERLCRSYGIEYVVKPGGELLDLTPRYGVCSPNPSPQWDQLPDVPESLTVDGTFIKGTGDAIYQMKDQTKHAFTDWNTFLRYGGAADLSNVKIVPDTVLSAIPDGSPIVVDDFDYRIQDLERKFGRQLRKFIGVIGG